MDVPELKILTTLDRAVASKRARTTIEAIVVRLELTMRERVSELLVWEPVPLNAYDVELPASIRSS